MTMARGAAQALRLGVEEGMRRGPLLEELSAARSLGRLIEASRALCACFQRSRAHERR